MSSQWLSEKWGCEFILRFSRTSRIKHPHRFWRKNRDCPSKSSRKSSSTSARSRLLSPQLRTGVGLDADDRLGSGAEVRCPSSRLTATRNRPSIFPLGRIFVLMAERVVRLRVRARVELAILEGPRPFRRKPSDQRSILDWQSSSYRLFVQDLPLFW